MVIKVAIISYLFEKEHGGAAISSQLIAKGLASHGVDVTVITTHPYKKLNIDHQEGIKIYRFFPKNLYWVAKKGDHPYWKRILWQLFDIWNSHSYSMLKHLLRKEKPDLIHINKLRGLSPSVWSAAKACNIPIIQTCRDYEIMSPEGTLSGRGGKMG